MDEDSLRNWGYYEPPLKGNLGLQLMSSVSSINEQDTKPFLPGRDYPLMVSPNGSFNPRDCLVTEPPVTHMDYVRDTWINNRDKFLHMFPGNPYNPVLAEPSASHNSVPMLHHPDTKETQSSIGESSIKKQGTNTKKRAASSILPKAAKVKKPRKPKEECNSSVQANRAKTVKRNSDIVINGIDMDISGIPIPVCSCTGTSQQCYRWGCGGWQSACCTTTISMYPLPMSSKRRGARIAGRKMSQGAFKKVLEKLASECYNFANPIDLKSYWAKHGTNKFVIIR